MLFRSKKEHFYKVNGYDESFAVGWGMDDTNFQFRCRMQNNLELVVQDSKYNSCLSHDNEIRTKNCMVKDIDKTRNISQSLLIKTAQMQNYISNVNRSWGDAQFV